MGEPTWCSAARGTSWARVDALFTVAGIHVLAVGWHGGRLRLTIETGTPVMGCPTRGVVAESHGRRERRLHNIAAFGPGRADLAGPALALRRADVSGRECSPRRTISRRRGRS
jgi:hypothetical protein